MIVTGSVNTTVNNMTWPPHTCVIRFTGASGSNGHERREHGVCDGCGARYVRTINWRMKNMKPWARDRRQGGEK